MGVRRARSRAPSDRASFPVGSARYLWRRGDQAPPEGASHKCKPGAKGRRAGAACMAMSKVATNGRLPRVQSHRETETPTRERPTHGSTAWLRHGSWV